jgi:UDP-N-acetylmuramoylalanine--D-glutamate ligase
MLNLSEDHLDRYDSIADYAAAKARIFAGGGMQVLNRDDPRSMAMRMAGRRVLSFGLDAPRGPSDFGLVEQGGALWLAHGAEALLDIRELKIAGLHNAANALAALALCHALGLPYPPLLAALRDFRGLPHRVEPVAEVGGVAYYDDSKGTNVGATVAALAGFSRLGHGAKVVLIAGGEGKSQDFAPLAPAVTRTARAVVLIGRDAPLIERAISGAGVPVRRAIDMEEAVALAAASALSGDAVLLSPACASFDMYRNYAHRGEAFRDAVLRRSHATAH